MDWGEVNQFMHTTMDSCISKDNEDPSWSTSFKTRRAPEDIFFSFGSALEDFISVVFVPDRNIIPPVLVGSWDIPTLYHSYSSFDRIVRNGYLRKGRKTKPKRQNRTRNGKAWKRQSPVKQKA
ncbi:hypothetical protein Tco_0191483 [Tanacetum coccineum]